MNFLWSIFYLLLSIGFILIYVALFASVPLMIYYITFANCNWLRRERHYFWSGVKFLVITALSVGIPFGYLNVYFLRVKGLPHDELAWVFQVKFAIMLGLCFFYGCLLINVFLIDREKKKKSETNTFFSQYYRGKAAKKIALGIIVVCLTVYAVQRGKWMGKDNANLEAKEYWVAGQVLNGFRMVLTTAINPDVPIMVPLNWVQQKIYDEGVSFIPPKDGEIGVWNNAWFLYPYSRMNREPLMGRYKLMTAFLDKAWFSLKAMATRPYADHQMEVEHYYRDFVALAVTYDLDRGWYSGSLFGSANRMAQMPKHVQRARDLSRWLLDLRKKWAASPKTKSFIDKHPKLLAMQQYVLSFELMYVIDGEIFAREFKCNDQAVQLYVKNRKEFVDSETGLAAYKRMKSKSQAKLLYKWMVNDYSSRSTKYVLKHFCGIMVAGKEDNSYDESFAKYEKMTAAEEAERSAMNNYSDEIRILREMFHER